MPGKNNAIIISPFNPDLELDERSFCSVLEFVIASGADGVIITGTTGEFFSLDRGEKARLVKLASQQIRGRASLIVGVGDTCLREAVALATLARENGASAVLVPPPYYMAWASKGIEEYFITLAERSRIDLMIYDGGGGTEVPYEVLKAVSEGTDFFRHLKLTTRDVGKVRKVPELCQGKVQVFGGEDTLILQELLAGAVGVATAAGLLNAGAINDVIRLVREGNLEQAQAEHDRWLAPQAIVTGSVHREFIQCFKAALKMMKVISNDVVRPPLVKLNDDRRRAVELMLKSQSKL